MHEVGNVKLNTESNSAIDLVALNAKKMAAAECYNIFALKERFISGNDRVTVSLS
ncbi:hypothetical protein AB5N19_11860 [Seiridium cardinale]